MRLYVTTRDMSKDKIAEVSCCFLPWFSKLNYLIKKIHPTTLQLIPHLCCPCGIIKKYPHNFTQLRPSLGRGVGWQTTTMVERSISCSYLWFQHHDHPPSLHRPNVSLAASGRANHFRWSKWIRQHKPIMDDISWVGCGPFTQPSGCNFDYLYVRRLWRTLSTCCEISCR